MAEEVSVEKMEQAEHAVSAAVDSASSEEEKEKVTAKLASMSDVFSFGAGPKTKLLLFLGFTCSCVSGCVFPAMAFYFSRSFEELGAATSADNFLADIRGLAFAFMVLGVFAGVFMTAQATLLETAAGIMTHDLKTKWFEALLRQDLAYYDIKDVSGTATIISTNGAKYKKGVGRKMGEGVQFFITFVGGMSFAFYSSWRASLVVLLVLPVMSLSVMFLVKINSSQSARAKESFAEAGSIVYTTVSAIRTVLALNAVPEMIAKFKSATEKAYHGAASQVHLIGLANGSMMGSFLVSYLLTTLYGAYLLYDELKENGCDPSGTVPENDTCDQSGSDVFGALMGITFAGAVLPQVSAAIESITGARGACYPALVAMRRTVGSEGKSDNHDDEQDISKKDEIPLPPYAIDSSSSTGKKLTSITGEIQFESVQFSYPTRQETLVCNDFSLTIPAGKTVALVGPSGGGKSTIMQLLERFYDPIGGSIKMDGVNLKDLNVKWLREQIGLVSQEPSLFARTIKENIAYGCQGATQEQIENAAKMANAHDFIASFPDGYDTKVGDKGAQLSGGQKQRIAIARVLIKNPKILLLDEATSALDSESETVVQKALDNLLEVDNRTTLVIAHRLSTIRNADMIVVCASGQVVETGTHDELLDKKGHYFDLVEAQKTPTLQREDTESSSGPPSRSQSHTDLAAVDDNTGETPIVRLKDVHFSYPSRPDNSVFKGLSLSVKQGETLALVGPSGEGKSTVIQLVERFYDPDSGTVELEGIDVKKLNVKWLRDQLGLVSQEPTLFNTTIAENIRYGRPDATQEDIEAAAMEANAHTFITSFPEGYQTPVGEQGTKVSGGQKQRIALARALIKKPRLLLLDEATSALDSESERIVQEALDKVMASSNHTVIVIAHRLSTIRNADRIAVVSKGKVKEIGTHDELMAKPNGRYRRLQEFQNLEKGITKVTEIKDAADPMESITKSAKKKGDKSDSENDDMTLDAEKEKENARRARLLAKGDELYFIIGGIGAILAGLVFPGWGFIFAYMVELLYTPVFPCSVEDGILPPDGFETCQDYLNDVADDMKQLSFKVTYGVLGTIAATLLGNMLVYYGFGIASEKMNKRVRDSAFQALVRQEVAFYDLRSVGSITSQFQDDAALIHSFSGEPIRTLLMNLASVLVGVVVSFVYMWPFALLTLATLPFMAFGAEAEMQMYMGEDEVEEEDVENSPGGIVVETLLNIRTVASLTIEDMRSDEYSKALIHEEPHPMRTNFVKGSTSGLGQFIQMWGIALMFWWGGWLLYRYPSEFEYNDFLISMFALLFSLSGTAAAAQNATNRDKAKAACDRIFDLVDRQSAIDPLSEEGAHGKLD